MAGSDADVAKFLTNQDYPGRELDDRIAVDRVQAAARTVGHTTVVDRAQTALDSKNDQAYRDFLDNAQYDALVIDERIAVDRIMAAAGDGTEVKAAAQVALDNTPAALRQFLTTGQFLAAQRDQDTAAHNAIVTSLLGQVFRIAATAAADAAQAQAAAATARNAATDAAGYAQQARESEKTAGGYAQQALSASAAADADAARAAQSAKTAQNAAKSANASAVQADTSAVAALLSANRAAAYAADANASALRAYNSAKHAEQNRDAAKAALEQALTTYADRLAADQKNYDESVKLREDDCQQQYGDNDTAKRLCVYLITNPVDEHAKALYLELKNGPICSKLHPLPDMGGRPGGLADGHSQAWLDCVHEGPGDGITVKILQYVSPFADLAGGSINDLARRLHIDPAIVAMGIGISLAGLSILAELAPELLAACGALCGTALHVATPFLAPEFVGMMDFAAFLTLYGVNAEIAIGIGGGVLVGIESTRIAAFAERETVQATATESQFSRFIRAIKACVNGTSFTPVAPALLSDGTSSPIKGIRIGGPLVSIDPVFDVTGSGAIASSRTGIDGKYLADTDGTAMESTAINPDNHPLGSVNLRKWAPAGNLQAKKRLQIGHGARVQAATTLSAWRIHRH